MASPVPAKSQPLHNFSLPHLKWKNHRTGRNRLAGDTSSSSPPHRSPSSPYLHQSSPYVSRRPSPLLKQSPMRDLESESEPNGAVPIGKPSRKTPMRYSESEFEPNGAVPIGKPSRTPVRYSESEAEQYGVVSIGNPSRKKVFDKSTKSSKSLKSIGNSNSKGKRSNNKICIRFRNNAAVITENHTSSPVETGVLTSAAEEEQKTWNLRPRRPPMSHKQSSGLPKIGSSPLPENRYFHGSNSSNKEVSEKYNDRCDLTTSLKHKFSISLSREEIEEDMFSLTGGKPSRRPKKRPRTVQKQLDTLFPGLWLGSITADSYKVSESTPKVS